MLTEKEIQEAADHAATIAQKQNEIDYEGLAPFELGFEQGVQWALEQMKQKELSNRCHCWEIEIEAHICPYKEEIYKDSKTLCNCCDYCKKQCKKDI